jgi:surface protein
MVGIIVIGVIAGTIAATVFAVIPWSQDAAARQDLDSVRTAEAVSQVQTSQFTDFSGLRTAGLIQASATVDAAADLAGSCYVAVSASKTGTIFLTTDVAPEAIRYVPGSSAGCLSASALAVLVEGVGGTNEPAASTPAIDTSRILTISVDSRVAGCQTFTLPVQKGGTTVPTNVIVDWGDGSAPQTVTTDLASHTYATSEVRTVTVDGTFGQYGNGAATGSTSCVTDILTWGSGTEATSARFAFAFSPITSALTATPPSSITNMEYMFYGSTGFSSDVSGWDTSNVTHMSGLFRASSAFSSDVSGWNISKVTNLSTAFYESTGFSGDLNRWNTGNVTDMSNMFRYSSSFSGAVSSWDTSNVTDMTAMLGDSLNFSSDINRWNTVSVTNMSALFYGTTNFSSVVSDWNTSNVANMSSIFNGSTNFSSAVSGWNTSKVTDVNNMFNSSKMFNSDLSRWDMSNVTVSYSMFTNSDGRHGGIRM